MCMCVFVHVGHAKATIYDGWLRHKGVGRRLLYKVLETRPRSQCVVVMAVSVCILNAML